MEQDSKYVLCPYCGHLQSASDRCVECGGLFEPLSRRATQIAMGPWYIRDKSHPFRPGCSYEVLIRQIKAGKIKSTTILRGPTTKQFWAVARNVPGIAHLLGYCHRCGTHVSPDLQSCPQCSESFQAPADRNDLGLMYPTEAAALAAQQALEKELAQQSGVPGGIPGAGAGTPDVPSHTPAASTPAPPGANLLQEILGKSPASSKPALTTTPPPLPTAPAKKIDAPHSPLLRFDDEASASDTRDLMPPASTGTARSAEALNIASDDPSDTVASPRMNLTTWLLIFINILVLAGVIMLFWLFFQGQ